MLPAFIQQVHAWPFFPYLHDESQSVARAYDAACTRDFLLFDSNPRLVYGGQLDGSRPGGLEGEAPFVGSWRPSGM